MIPRLVGRKLAAALAAATIALAFAGLTTQAALADTVACGGSANNSGAGETCSIVSSSPTPPTSPPYSGSNAKPAPTPATCQQTPVGKYTVYTYEPLIQVPEPAGHVQEGYTTDLDTSPVPYSWPAGTLTASNYYYIRYTQTDTVALATFPGAGTTNHLEATTSYRWTALPSEWNGASYLGGKVVDGKVYLSVAGVVKEIPKATYLQTARFAGGTVGVTVSGGYIHVQMEPYLHTCTLSAPTAHELVAVPVGVSCDPDCVPKGGNYSTEIAEAQEWRLAPVTSNPPSGYIVVWIGTEFHANFSADPGVGSASTPYDVSLGNGRQLNATITVSILPYSFDWQYTASGGMSGTGFTCSFSTLYEVGGDSSNGGANNAGQCSSPNAGDPGPSGYVFTHDAQDLNITVSAIVQVSAVASWVDNTGYHAETLFSQDVSVPTSGPESSTIFQIEGV